MKAIITDRDYETLSAYMDGQLSPGERRKLEERMRARPDLRIALEDMRRMRALLRQAPRRRAPRNFTLTPAMVGEPRKRPFAWTNLFPALSFTSAIAALALVVIVTLQLGYGPQNMPASVAMQPPAATMQDAAPPQAPQAQAPEAGVPEATITVMEMPAEESAAEPAPEEGFSAKGAGTPEEEDPAMMAAAPEVEATLPPIINWNGVPGAPIGGASNTIPSDGVEGRGGGGADTGRVMGGGGSPEMGGMGGGPGGDIYGGLYLPPDSIESFEDSAAPEPQPTPEMPAAGSASDLTGTGPILGVPAAEDGGQIIDREAVASEANLTGEQVPAEPAGEPETAVTETAEEAVGEEAAAEEELPATEEPAPPSEIARAEEQEQPAAPESAPQAAPQPGPAVGEAGEAQPERVLGMAPRTLLIVEILLGLVTLLAGGAAFLLWRQRAGR